MQIPSFIKIGVLRNFPSFSGKQLCWTQFLMKQRLQDKLFPENIWEYLLLTVTKFFNLVHIISEDLLRAFFKFFYLRLCIFLDQWKNPLACNYIKRDSNTGRNVLQNTSSGCFWHVLVLVLVLSSYIFAFDLVQT